jgi:small subunit ribosomal protein S1
MVEQRNTAGEIITVKIVQANKGGLVAEYGNMQGFIPVSQLSFKHYPRVDGDRSKIQKKLAELIGKTMDVKILSFDKVTNKIIFSEKAAGDAEVEQKALNYTVGQKVKGKVTGIVDFGLFVNIGDIEGLVHISQASWQRINNLKDHFQVGQEVDAEVVSVDGGRISLSIKKLLPDPWQIEAKNLAVGDKVKGEVTKVTPYGAFVKLTENLEGLFHVSQMAHSDVLKAGEVSEVKPQEVVEEGKTYDFEIVSIELELRKISLKLAEETKKEEKITKPKKDEKPAKAKAKTKSKTVSKTKSSDKLKEDDSATS